MVDFISGILPYGYNCRIQSEKSESFLKSYLSSIQIYLSRIDKKKIICLTNEASIRREKIIFSLREVIKKHLNTTESNKKKKSLH